MSNRGNRRNYAKRSDDGRRGRGANAFEGKLTVNWTKTMERIEVIAARVHGGENGNAVNVGYPIHHVAEYVKGRKV